MRDFDRLTERGRRLRLRELALSVLAANDLSPRRCFFVAQSYNTIFGVDTAAGRHALRIGPARSIHLAGEEETEAAWMEALRKADLPVPGVLRAANGSLVVEGRSPLVPGTRPCVVFDWVAGAPLSERMNPRALRLAGRLTARVHEHGARYVPAAGAPVLVADRVLYWRNEPRLRELAPAMGTLLTEAAERAQAVLDELWANPPHPPHLLHGDIGPANIMASGRDVTLIYFQDLAWGFEIQDLAITEAALERYGEPALMAGFRAGYEEVRRWPDAAPGVVAGLIAARRLHQLNLGLNLRRPGLDAFIIRNVDAIRAWMSTHAT